MWTAVLVFGLGLALDPLRLGLVAIVLSQRRPIPNLVAFWLGGIVAGVGLGLVVLVFFRGLALTVIEHVVAAIESLRSSVVILAGGGLQITLGVIVLSVLAALVARRRVRVGVGSSEPSLPTVEQRPPNVFTRIAGVSQDLLRRGMWPSFLVGLGSATPPVECVVLLTIIMASGAQIATQMAAVVVFTVLVLALVEVPLLTYLAMPQRTEAVMLRLNGWLNAYRRRIVHTMMAVTGVVLVIQGVVHL